MRKSFKRLEHEVIILLNRHGYSLNTKLKNTENTDTKIYTKGLLDCCVISVHLGDVSSITLTFSENCIQMTYSALIVLTFNTEGDIDSIFVDHTDSHRYSAIFKEIENIIEKVGG
jgi:hypothetical protein